MKLKERFLNIVIITLFAVSPFSVSGKELNGNPIITGVYATSFSSSPPNIVIILTDDQGWGDLSIFGNINLKTPNIDRLAETGVTFDRFYVCPMCAPTRAELLTGRYYLRSGLYSTGGGGERINPDEITIADIFKKAGYVTAAYGKWHNGMQPPYHPNARGFDDFYGFCGGHLGNYFDPLLEHNGEIVKGNGFVADDFTDHGLDFMEQNKHRPFFLYLPFNTPHTPLQVPDKWWDKFKNKNLEMFHREPDKENIPFTLAALAMCENIDWNVGRLTDKIEDLGLSENTIIIYLSDNGPNSLRWNGGMKGMKGSTDEGGVRVPMFIKWDGTLNAGGKIVEISAAIDLLPTLVDLAGIEFDPEKPLDGVSLKPLLIGENSVWNERFIFNHWTGLGSILGLNSRYDFIDWKGNLSVRNQKFRMSHTGELFNMENDYGQYIDISSDYPEIKKEFLLEKEKWETEFLNGLPETDSRPFTIGHPDYKFTQIHAADGNGYGNIQRSSPYPSSSFFMNWISPLDSITWKVEVLADGDFEVEIYYTCPAEDIGATFELSFLGEHLTGKITKAHTSPLFGMENDRVKRGGEAYSKDFKPLKMGTIHLTKGEGTLTLKATDIPGTQVMEFELIRFKRI
jgi:arylsulfatase A-like enzyme